MTKISDLAESILKAQIAYYNVTEIISDDEYDALVYELNILDPDNEVLKKVGAAPANEWKKEKHLTVLGSLLKVNTPSELNDWMTSTVKKQSVVVTEKLDGLSIGCQYEDGKLKKAVLRGNGLEGENILQNVLKMSGVIKSFANFSGTLRGEIVLTKTNHKKYFSEYSNPRNAASGICRTLEGDRSKYLSLIFYQLIGDDEFKFEDEQLKFIKDNGGSVPNYYVCKSSDDVKILWEKYQNGLRDSLEYEIDGLVVSIRDLQLQQSLGEINLRPRAKKAFKFTNQFVKTTVENITWVTGNTGRITPICWFKEVNLLGSNITKASVYNIAYINKLGLDVGAEVLVCKANEIIPRVEKVVKSTGTVSKIPTVCPTCSTKVVMDGEYLVCKNKMCGSQVTGRIKTWISDLNILEWGETLIEKLVESGKVTTIADLYKLTVADLSSLDRMGDRSAQKCHDILWADVEIPLDVFVGALSITMIGSSTIRQIMSAGIDTLDKLMMAKTHHFENVSGVGPTRAQFLYDGLVANKDLINELIVNGVKIKKKISGKLSGKSCCFTGTMLNKRAVLEKMAADAGAEVKGGVGKGLSFLVINDVNSNSSKTVNAKKFGTQLITEDQFIAMVE